MPETQRDKIDYHVLLGLILLRVPIAFAMAAVGGFGFAYMRGWEPAWAMTGQVAFDTALSYSLSVIPLFIFMGNVLAGSGVAHGLFAGADRLFGRLRGGLAMASVLMACPCTRAVPPRGCTSRKWPDSDPRKSRFGSA